MRIPTSVADARLRGDHARLRELARKGGLVAAQKRRALATREESEPKSTAPEAPEELPEDHLYNLVQKDRFRRGARANAKVIEAGLSDSD